MPRVLLASNRLPVTLAAGSDGITVSQSSGGLATALGSVHTQGNSLWFGWPGPLEGIPDEVVARALESVRAVPIPLSAEEIRDYYDGFSNSVMWPLCHYLIDRVRLDSEVEWGSYQAVNQRFADAIATHWRRGDVVWIHDYQLALVPLMVRRLCPDARIGYFFHVPFPSSDVFRILPWREALLRGMLGADVVGFHTANYAYNFSYSCSQILGLEMAGDAIAEDGRSVQVGAFPIGVDVAGFEQRAALPAVRERAEEIRSQAGARTVVLSVDRLDYTKGIVPRLRAIERLLTSHPELAQRLHIIQLGVPTRENVDAYADFRKLVNEEVGRINSAVGTATRTIMHFMVRSVYPEELSALYLAADVMLVTPLRDGMNLVAKEYVASRLDDTGVLVLSELAGAATEMHDALQTNPYDAAGMAGTILAGVTMPVEEQNVRMAALRQSVRASAVQGWAQGFVQVLSEVVPLPTAASRLALAEELAQAAAAPSLLVVLDYDGTLVPFAAAPHAARPDVELLAILAAMVARPNTRVDVVSGRSYQSLEHFVGELGVGLHAEHGLWSRPRGSVQWLARAQVPFPWMEAVRPIIKAVVRRTNGSFLEEKSGSLAFHFRATEPQLSFRRAAELRGALERTAAADGFEIVSGHRVLEVRQRGVHKGVVVPMLLEANPGAAIVAIGDDRTDEDLFRALPSTATTIHVGSGSTEARFRLPDIGQVREVLKRLAASR